LKDPYKFDFLTLQEKALEKDIENQLVKHITSFLSNSISIRKVSITDRASDNCFRNSATSRLRLSYSLFDMVIVSSMAQNLIYLPPVTGL